MSLLEGKEEGHWDSLAPAIGESSYLWLQELFSLEGPAKIFKDD
jgi:hypothetical protein